MDAHTLDKLQFDRVRAVLADCCACTLGKNLARRIEPSRSADVVRRWFTQVREMGAAWRDHGGPPLAGVRDIHPQVRDAGTSAGLDEHELARVRETLQATANVRHWLATLGDAHELLRSIGRRVGDFSALAAQIDRAIDERARVRDDATPRLGTIRRSIDKARTEIEQVFDRILRHGRVLRMLQYPGATFHDDRRVLPLKADCRGQVQGIIHRSSDSGATLFVEPAEAVQLNNFIVSLHEDERKEIAAILGQLSLLVHRNEKSILETLEAVAVIDLIAAKVRYMQTREAVCPEVRDDRVLALFQGRHPLLLEMARSSTDGRAVVPIDVRLGDDFDLLIVTGPNTGGKTVAIKTVGLLALMAQCGIPIPAGPGSKVPVYRQVAIDVGDEQSIEQSLSTFSSHLSNILDMLRRADAGTLVLLDELGSGTDPDEGAAIGRAVIDELLRIGCVGIVTTHLSVLKAVAFTTARVDNASVEFDVESLKPTYHLRIGEPGNSNALIIAQRLGMPQRLVDSARDHLHRRGQALTKAIKGTIDSRRQAERARLEANQALLDAEQQRIHFEVELKKLEREREAHYEWFQWLNRLTPGDDVFVRKFGRSARIVRLQLQKQTALVASGPVEMEVHLSELTPPQRE